MGKLTIIGNDKPVIGKQEMYSVSSVSDWLNPLKSIKNPLQVPKTHWEVMVQTKTGWRKGGSDKEGQIVPYIFGQKSLLHKGIKIVVRQGEDSGELIVHPQRAKEPKITRVELLDVNYNPIPKGKKLNYKDTIIARAYCVEMFGMNISFTLWEDDAQGEGHNPAINGLNKINPVPVLGRVNEKGMAEAVFRLPFYTMAVLIANARTASGDKSEGATHEYYVTADVVSKHIQKASPNVNVVNPTHIPETPRKRELPKGHTPPPAKPKTTPVPEKPKPDSPKFPVTTGGKKSDDPQGKILSAEFVDNNGNKLHSSKVGATVIMKITAKDMKNKKVTVKIWEEDNFSWTNDLIYKKDWVLVGDTSFIGVVLTKEMFDKAKGIGTDNSRQDYFIEVIRNNTTVTSGVMPVSIDATPTEVESGNSATMVKKPKQGKTPTSCICKEQYKDLIWGGKVSCEFRKKVVQIAKNLGLPQEKNEGANRLMAVMALETMGTFDHTYDNKMGYYGLIQFGDSAASTLKTTTSALIKMTAIQQLDYVEKHIALKKDKIKNLTDLYLCILLPNLTGKGNEDNYVLWTNSREAYYNNPAFHKEDGEWENQVDTGKKDKKGKTIYKRGYDKNVEAKTYMWEVRKAIENWYQKGNEHKAKTYECQLANNSNEKINATGIVTYHIYDNGTIEKHIPKIIKPEYAKKYKYVYHDKENKEHDICITDWHKTTKKLKSKKKLYSKPTHSKVLSDNIVNEGQTKRRVIYENGDIAEYGSNKGDTFWRLYVSTSEEIELVKMPESVNYVKYSFSGTKRQYTGPNYFAGFIGALAKTGYSILTTGSCFKFGSCFPSQLHVNGESIDTKYFWKLEEDQKFIDTMMFFHFGERKVGNDPYFKKLKNTSDGGDLHDDHLHSGNFDVTKVKIIKEK